ncbi:MAG: hypothetical protein ACE14P_13545 [Methanotrichaceae archaeon]
MNAEDLLPSARLKHRKSAVKVVKPESLSRLEETDKFQPLPPTRKKRVDQGKIDPTERWWI